MEKCRFYTPMTKVRFFVAILVPDCRKTIGIFVPVVQRLVHRLDMAKREVQFLSGIYADVRQIQDSRSFKPEVVGENPIVGTMT